MNNEYLNTKEAREMLRVTAVTLRKWAREGKIDFIRLPSNERLYNKQSIYNILNITVPIKPKEKIAYCRVSSIKQNDDLDRQKAFFNSEYPDHRVVTDIGSGINWKRKGFKGILEQAINGDIEQITIAHRDRLCRFAFDLVEWILQLHKVKLVVLDDPDFISPDKELADDVLSIIHIYSCRKMGKRMYKTKGIECKQKNIENKTELECAVTNGETTSQTE